MSNSQWQLLNSFLDQGFIILILVEHFVFNVECYTLCQNTLEVFGTFFNKKNKNIFVVDDLTQYEGTGYWVQGIRRFAGLTQIQEVAAFNLDRKTINLISNKSFR